MNVFDGLARAYRFRKKATAIDFGGSARSYESLYWNALTIAYNFRRAGIKKGDRVALLLPNCPEFVLSYYGIGAVGAVVVSINVMNTRDEVRHIVIDSGARVLVTSSELISQVPTLDELPDLICGYALGGNGPWPDRFEPFTSLLKTPGPIPEEWECAGPNDPASILYTSGTTGEPKGATLTVGNVIANVYATNHHTRSTPDERILCFLPLFHCFGQNFIMNAAIHAAATLVLEPRFDADQVVARLEETRVTRVFGVPTVFSRLLRMSDAADRLRSVGYWFSAAATLSLEIEGRWQTAFGKPIYQGYGMTECSPFAAYNHDFSYRPGSIGSPIENVDLKVLDLEGNEMADGTCGEIAIRGPNVMLGYHNRPQETAEVIRDGWLHSGDWGYRDDEGYFYIVDRVKDMINVAGFKVWPREVEEVLSRNPSIIEAAVVGVPDADAGELVKAVVVPDPSCPSSPDCVIELCRRHLARYKVPKLVEFRSSLPKNAAGKILKRELRDE